MNEQFNRLSESEKYIVSLFILYKEMGEENLNIYIESLPEDGKIYETVCKKAMELKGLNE